MLDRSDKRRAAGFTLTEMAIVLAVVGVLIAGLWNLIAGANQTSRDTSAATQQVQLISAVKEFLLSSSGQNFLSSNTVPGGCGGPCPVSKAFSLPIPAACPAAGDPNWIDFCNYLPPGFKFGTVNSYGQTFLIQIQRDSSSAAGTPPTSYSFMIVTKGPAIPDTSGGRIASLIGGEGGFIYAGPVCITPASTKAACGSYGSWTVADITAAGPAGYAYGAPANAGLIASRSYISPQQNLLSNWLARVKLDPFYVLNTMSVPEYLGGYPLVMGSYNGTLPPQAPLGPPATGGDIDMGAYLATTNGGNINMAAGTINFVSPGALAGGGIMNAQGGTINFASAGAAVGGGTMNVQGGTIYLSNTSAADAAYDVGIVTAGDGVINLQGGSITSSVAGASMGNDAINLNGAPGNTEPVITANMACTIKNYDPVGAQWVDGGGAPCSFAIQTSSLQSPGLISAFGFYAGTFVYNTGSDRRLKKDIKPLVGPLADVMKLNPVSFTYKDSGVKSMGVIAQELEKVYPDLVSFGDKGMKYVNYDGLIGPLIGAIQELKKENEDLRKELDIQKAREDKLEGELHQKANH